MLLVPQHSQDSPDNAGLPHMRNWISRDPNRMDGRGSGGG